MLSNKPIKNAAPIRRSASQVEPPVRRRASQKLATLRLRHIAAEEPQELGLAIDQLGGALTALADKLLGLSENLDLVALPKDASVRQKMAARQKYARGLRRLAEENPEELAVAMNEFYAELEAVVNDTEILAENLKIKLDVPEDVEEESTDETPEDTTEEAPEDATEETTDENPLSEYLDDEE